MKRAIRIIFIFLLVAFIIIQFIRPNKNVSAEIPGHQITAKHNVPADVQKLLKASCYDCHSNTTEYPWYWHVQPVAWFLNKHIQKGKRHLNFSEFSTYLASKQYKKLKEIAKEVKSDDMPMYSYTLIHRSTSLTEDQKMKIQNWVVTSMKEMEIRYPSDSLKKR